MHSYIIVVVENDLFYVCLQHTSRSPDGKLVIIVGDNTECMLVDSISGKVILYFQFTSRDHSLGSNS